MTWVLLRGLTREARHWGDLPQRLAEVTGIGQVIALDLPGNGEFCAQASPRSVRAMVGFARWQLLAQGLQPPYSLLAMSLGGMVATDWAQHHPHEVTRLVLINTSMRPYSGISDRLRPGNWLQLLLLAARWRDTDYAERVIHQLTCQQRALRDQDLAAWRRIRSSAPVSAANAWRQLWAAARFCSAAAPPPCPALVLSSARDQLVHPLCSARLAQAWQAEHQQHPWAGHDLPHDDVDWVGQRLAGWLGKN
ncbi:MAG TPA: alpha/beta hydrolase [Polaromonas sp.]|jgi:pimeloyl-ACP methyl ester carboxylesterase